FAGSHLEPPCGSLWLGSRWRNHRWREPVFTVPWTASLAYQGDPSRILFVSRVSDLDGQCGLWSRAKLLVMDARFCDALEQAFEAKLESRAAAAATVRLGPRLNGSRLLKEQAAIGAAWNWFREAKFEATAVEVVARVRASCASVTAEQVRAEFKKRLVRSDGVVVRSSGGPDGSGNSLP